MRLLDAESADTCGTCHTARADWIDAETGRRIAEPRWAAVPVECPGCRRLLEVADDIDRGVPAEQRRAWSARFVAARPEHHDPYLAELHAERDAADREVDAAYRASGHGDPPAGA